MRIPPWKPSPKPAPWLRTPEPPEQGKEKIQKSSKREKRGKNENKPCILERTQKSHAHPKKPLSPTKTSESNVDSPDQLPPHHALGVHQRYQDPRAPNYEERRIPLLTPGPKSPHQSLLGIGRASTIGVAPATKNRPSHNLPSVEATKNHPSPRWMGGSQPETSELSPPLTNG